LGTAGLGFVDSTLPPLSPNLGANQFLKGVREKIFFEDSRQWSFVFGRW